MPLTVMVFLYLGAFIAALANAITPGRCPLWVAVILLCIAGMLTVLPR